MRMEGTWDMGLDYLETRKKLARALEDIRKKDGTRALTQRLYLMILLTQVRNGSRIGEAIDFLKLCYQEKIYKKKQREGYVRVEKRSDNAERLMVIPEELNQTDFRVTEGIFYEKYQKGKKHFVATVSTWIKRKMGYNTHSLRYAYISYLGKKGYPAQIIAKITKHKQLNMILNYTQEIQANQILREIG